ncbi:vacuolar protein sorting-associated protein 8 homolog [Liolophura sinensis]|uniref:vacuolar protein sorting-associated protein 8 homolog n=1 Tax=Liolophura sinensis TaxID=3198878 RepID=UPI003158538B
MADDVSGNPSGVSETLDFSLEELDDKEFDLPSIDTVPTLESILNEPDNESVLDDEDLAPVQLIHGDSLETSSVSSQESLLSDRTRKKDRSHRTLLQETHGSILRPSKLKNISAQLLSAADRVDAGMPTAMAVSNLIAVGTSHGLVLVFDPKQVLKWCLGSTAVGAQYGSVSSLSFNRDCTRLLSGFAKGQITMWDLTTGKLLRTITDAHPAGTAVLHVKFTDSFTVAVCSDSGGSVFELEFKRLIGVRTCDSRCLFSGSRGEVCIVEPLHMNLTIKDHPMQDVMILAMGTLSKVLLVSLKPQLKVMFTHPLKGDSSTLPLLAWQFVIIQVSERDRVIDPVLAFARDSAIYFYQVVCNTPQDIKCQGLQKMEVPYRLLSIQWMNPRTLVCLDTAEKLHVIDVRSEEELEVIDISDVQLVYGSSHFKSLATGGNVSQALAYAGGQACYQSVVSYSGQLFLLGTKTVHVMSLRTWRERIDVLVKQNRYRDALALALSFYEGRAKAVLGLSGSPQKKRETIAELMLDLLFEFVDLSMTQFCPDQGKVEELEEYYQTVVPVCVDYCLHLGRTVIPIANYMLVVSGFGYITNIMRSTSYSEEEKFTLQKQAMAKLQELVEIDCKQAAQMVITGFATNLNDIVAKLSNNRKLQFQFLQGVILYKDTSGSAINTDRQISIDPEIYELYIDLLCQFKPGDVANYVKMTEGYRLEQTLAICRRHKISDAMAFLLEKAGDVQGAFSIILENLQGKLKAVTEVLQDPSQSGKDLTVELGEVQAVLLVIIQLCQRNSNKMDEAGREALWFPLLEAMMSPQRKIKDVAEKRYVDEVKELTHHVLNSMMGYIALPAILQKIMQDPAYNTGKFGEVKELILGMLETYNYEETLMTTCKNLMYHDLHLHLSHLTAVAGRSYIARQQQCNMCSKHYSGILESEAIIVFRCGHSYHTNCLQSVGSVHLVEGEEVWVCYLCSNMKRGRLHSTRFHRALLTPSGSQSIPRTDTNNQSKEFSIDPQAIEAFENFRRSMKTPSRLAILMELSKSGAGTKLGHSRTPTSILQNERFQLRLAPPPLESS